jgi:hypothetical protein
MQNEQLLFYPSGDRHNIFRNRVEQTNPYFRSTHIFNLFILHLRFHELALDKSSSTCCYVTKQTSLSSRHKVGPGWLNELGSWIT